MIGIYMSGTGNTKYCVGKLLSVIDPKAEEMHPNGTRIMEGR